MSPARKRKPAVSTPSLVEESARDSVKGEVDAARADVAFRAVKRARQMEPQLTSFSRAITGRDDVRCVVGAGATSTDGQVIYLRPPMKLGYVKEHNRLVCGRRDDNSKQICPACAQIDEVFSSMFHEIAHIVFDSFKSLGDKDRAEILTRAVGERPALAGTRYAKLREAIERIGKGASSYIEICGVISPYLQPMVNCLEDARVNKSMYEAREGTYAMFRGLAIDVFENGLEMPDGKVMRWDEAPDNSQIMIGLYCKSSGFDYANWFKPEVVEVLNDPEVTRLVRSLDNARTVAAVYRTSFPIIERLRELGYCKAPEDLEDDPPPPPPPPTEPEESEESEPDDDKGDCKPGGEGESDKEPDDCSGEADEVDGDGDDAEGDGAGDGGSGQDDTEAPEPGDDEDGAGGSMTTDGEGDKPEADSTGDGGSDSDEPDDAPGRSSVWSDHEDGTEESDGDSDDDGDPPDGDGDPSDDDGDPSDGSGHDGGDAGSGPRTGLVTGSAGEALEHVRMFGGHEDTGYDPEKARDEAEIDRAVVQEACFDAPSQTVYGVRELDYRSGEGMWGRTAYQRANGSLPKLEDIVPPDGLVNGAVQKARVAFADNKRARVKNNMRSGRIDTKRLHTVPTGNKKVFGRVASPSKRDYFIALSLDVSGSTASRGRIELIRKMGLAIGDMLHRLGVDFAVYAHSGEGHGGGLLDVHMYQIKTRNQPWDTAAREATASLTPYSANLDGHTLEYLRKVCDKSSATDRMILYCTDGQMPAENRVDELAVLLRELQVCAQRGYEILGVGIQNNDPTQYGLETVRLDTVEDLPKLVKAIDDRLSGRG